MTTLGRYLVQALESAGVRHVFGIPGMHNLELYRALQGASMRHITGRHEQGLGFMADGYARVSGRPGVCFTISGPGVSNIATAIGQAYGDSIPMLVIASQNRPGEAGSGRGFLHELLDQRGLAGALTGASYAIREPGELPAVLTQAFGLFAAARPRPVYVEIPLNLLAADAAALVLPGLTAAAPVAATAAVETAAQQLRAAARPVVLAGGGAVRAAAELRRLVEHLGAPLVMTSNARGLLPPGHALAVPMSPSLEPVRALIAGADLVLAVGTEIGPTDFDMFSLSEFPPPRDLIRIDIDADQLQRNALARTALHGDSAATLRALLSRDLGAMRPRGGQAAAAAVRTQALASLSPPMRTQLQLLDLIRDTLPQALLVGDSTQMVYAGLLAFEAATPGSWFNSATGYGTLGYALPASTGAGLAAPQRPVVCLVGDGGLQFSLGELAVLREVDAWTAIIIWNNRGFGEIRTAMIAAQIQPAGVDVQPADFALLSAAYGYRHRLIESAAAFEAALREFAGRRQVMVLELASD
jgi:acetolactate synthase-1/2/3 large subunit